MITENAVSVIERVFPDVKVEAYDGNESYIQLDKITSAKIAELVDVTKSWSGITWYMMPSDEKIQIVFVQVAFSA